MLLAGDIGGTNTRLLLYDNRVRKPVRESTLPSRAVRSLEAAVRAFLGPRPPRVRAAVFGIAGPVFGGRVKTTNLPWEIDEKSLARALRVPQVRVVNDLVSIAYGASATSRRKLAAIQAGALPHGQKGTVAVLAAGTGLGEAALVWDGARYVPCGSEGGHADFAPRSALEVELLEFLSERFAGHVSYERVVSGPGLGNIYDFFLAKGARESRLHVEALAQASDRNRAIAELGRSGKSPVCKKALSLFLSIYGAEAGNLALKYLSMGGVFVAGGIAASLLSMLTRGPFLEAFLDKGRFRPLLRKIPVHVVIDSNVGLAGALRYASTLAAES
jgi:glucokinase